MLQNARVNFLIPDDPFMSLDFFLAGLKLGLHQSDNISGFPLKPHFYRGQNEVQRDKRNVNCDKFGRFRQFLQLAGVCAVHHHHERVVPQAGVQFVLPDVNRVNFCRAAL